MKIKVCYFASYREKIGLDKEVLELLDETSIGDLASKISETYGFKLENLLVAVNGIHSSPERKLNEGDVVAFFPPVTGG